MHLCDPVNGGLPLRRLARLCRRVYFITLYSYSVFLIIGEMEEKMTPWWLPEVFAKKHAVLRVRAHLMMAVRHWFDQEGFTEVDTPALQVSPGMEPHLKAFATEWVQPDGDRAPRYLHTSPEFAMKKLLVAGMGPIYQLGRVFRNEERGTTHSPEFTMLEWYRPHAGYGDLMDDAMALIRLACETAGTKVLCAKGHEADPFLAPEILSVPDAIGRYCGIDLMATMPDPLRPDADLLAEAARGIGVMPHRGDTWEDIFFRLMLDRVEPYLGVRRVTILCDYPISLAALARPKPEDPRLAERFELYGCGVELANAFGELTDADLQESRFVADMALMARLYGHAYPIDQDFLAALRQGMPPSAGIALGFDRLLMVATGVDRIDDVLWVPVS